jgi:Four helix bundle sensory module for signal transduction
MGGQIKNDFRTSARKTLASTPGPMTRGISRDLAIVLLGMVFSAEAGIGLLMFHDLSRSHSEMQRMYERSVRGLRQIGEMQYEAQETRRSTLYALTTNDANLQVGYADMSRAADSRVKRGISEYLAQASTPQELAAGRLLASDWNEYLKVRDDVLGRILESSTQEAVAVDLASGVPKFDRVHRRLGGILPGIDTIDSGVRSNQCADIQAYSIPGPDDTSQIRASNQPPCGSTLLAAGWHRRRRSKQEVEDRG